MLLKSSWSKSRVKSHVYTYKKAIKNSNILYCNFSLSVICYFFKLIFKIKITVRPHSGKKPTNDNIYYLNKIYVAQCSQALVSVIKVYPNSFIAETSTLWCCCLPEILPWLPDKSRFHLYHNQHKSCCLWRLRPGSRCCYICLRSQRATPLASVNRYHSCLVKSKYR